MGLFDRIGSVVNSIRRNFPGKSEEDQEVKRLWQDHFSSSSSGNYPYSSRGSSLFPSGIQDRLNLKYEFSDRLRDYEMMDEYPEISLVLDLYADDATQTDLEGRTIYIESDDEEINEDLMGMFRDDIDIEDKIWSIARGVAKYGNYFQVVYISERGVIEVDFIPPAQMRRIHDVAGNLVGFVYSPDGEFDLNPQKIEDAVEAARKNKSSLNEEYDNQKYILYEPWQVVHFRMMDRNRGGKLGVSIIEPARWIWRRLRLLEDTAILYRLTRSPERFIYGIEVGDLTDKEAQKHLEDIRREFSRDEFVDRTTGKIDESYSPLSHQEDFFIPMHDGRKEVEIETTQSPVYQFMDDVEYFRSKLLTTLKIPDEFTSFQELLRNGQVLSQVDPRFARSVVRLQRAIRQGLKKIADIHLSAQGVDPETVDFNIKMVSPDAVFELARLEVESQRAGLARDMEDYVSNQWILSNVFNFSDEEIETIKKQKDEESGDDGGGRFGSYEPEGGEAIKGDVDRGEINQIKRQVQELSEKFKRQEVEKQKFQRRLEQINRRLKSSMNNGRMTGSEGGESSISSRYAGKRR